MRYNTIQYIIKQWGLIDKHREGEKRKVSKTNFVSAVPDNISKPVCAEVKQHSGSSVVKTKSGHSQGRTYFNSEGQLSDHMNQLCRG